MQSIHVEEHENKLHLYIRVCTKHSVALPRRVSDGNHVHDLCRGRYGHPPHTTSRWFLRKPSRYHPWHPSPGKLKYLVWFVIWHVSTAIKILKRWFVFLVWTWQIFICVLICPFDTFYRPTRFCFIRILRNIVCSPFYKVLICIYIGIIWLLSAQAMRRNVIF